jgi:hypothetical protein
MLDNIDAKNILSLEVATVRKRRLRASHKTPGVPNCIIEKLIRIWRSSLFSSASAEESKSCRQSQALGLFSLAQRK